MQRGKVFDSVRVLGAALGVLLFGQAALAQDEGVPPDPADDLKKPPPLPPKVQDEQIEPTVTIREEDDQRVEEYSYNGRVYMIKVTPENGIPYYYVDTDGDGNVEKDEKHHSLDPVDPVHWKVKEWK